MDVHQKSFLIFTPCESIVDAFSVEKVEKKSKLPEIRTLEQCSTFYLLNIYNAKTC